MKMIKPLEVRPDRQVLSQGTYEILEGLILNHEIAPSDRISIDQLARELHVSPTPVREALARLESARLVEKEPLRGYRATPLLDAEGFVRLSEFRAVVEPAAARRAAERSGARELGSSLSRLVDGYDNNAESPLDRWTAFIAHDTAFHTELVVASGNDFLVDAYDGAHAHLHLLRLMRASWLARDGGLVGDWPGPNHFDRYYPVGAIAQAVDEHRQIAVAIARGDSDDAARATVGHIAQSRERFTSGLLP